MVDGQKIKNKKTGKNFKIDGEYETNFGILYGLKGKYMSAKNELEKIDPYSLKVLGKFLELMRLGYMLKEEQIKKFYEVIK